MGRNASLAVGFTRFGTYAIAKTIEGVAVFEDPAEEQARASGVPIERLGFERTLAYITGLANVRDAIPFPRTPGNARY